METPTELIELITLKTSNLAGLQDRFSDLPEPIILHVFSFLGSNDIASLCYVSRQFRKLSMSSPNLLFKLEFDSKKCTANCKQLQRFLKGLLNQHNAPEIHRLCLHWFCHSSRYDAKGSIFGKWVQKALRNKVQELEIGVPVTTGKALYLPAGIESLRVLKLKLQGGKPKLFTSVFASLEALSLTSVSVPDLEFGEWVSHSCKSLKILNLEDVNGIENLIISSSSLKVLTVVSCNADEDWFGLDQAKQTRRYIFLDPPGCIDTKIFIHCSGLESLAISKCEFDNLYLNVTSPSLKDLQICDCKTYGYFDISISAEQLQTLYLTMQFSFCVPEASLSRCRIYSDNLLSLSNATVNLVPCSTTFSLADNLYREFNSNGLVDFIHSVRYAKILQLNSQIIEALSPQGQLPNITFEHLEHLEVIVVESNDFNDIDITAIAALLGCCSNLKTLTLRCGNNASEISETELVLQLMNHLTSEVEKCGNTRITCNVIN